MIEFRNDIGDRKQDFVNTYYILPEEVSVETCHK